MNLKTFLEASAERGIITNDELSLLMRAVSSRGKYKGRVRASLPRSGQSISRGVWRSIISNAAPNRAGLFSLAFCAPEAEREAYLATESIILKAWGSAFTRVLGGHLEPFRFNLVATRVRDMTDKQLLQALDRRAADLQEIAALEAAKDVADIIMAAINI